MAGDRTDLPPGYDISVATRGPWWTAQDPSLCLPRAAGEPARIWSAGDGPSLLLVPPPGRRHQVWDRASPLLAGTVTLHAVDRLATPFTEDVAHLVTAAQAVGARFVAGWAADAAVLHAVGERAECVRRVTLLVPDGSATVVGSGQVTAAAVSVGDAAALTAADAAAIVDGLTGGGRGKEVAWE